MAEPPEPDAETLQRLHLEAVLGGRGVVYEYAPDHTVVVFTDGGRDWYYKHQLHRTRGPAIEYTDGSPSQWLRHNKL